VKLWFIVSSNECKVLRVEVFYILIELVIYVA